MPRRYSKKSHKIVQIARRRISFLFDEAMQSFAKDSALSDKYVRMARRIAMKYKVRLPAKLKKRFCKHCHRYLVPGSNCRVRLHKHRLIYYCQSCRHFMRQPVK